MVTPVFFAIKNLSIAFQLKGLTKPTSAKWLYIPRLYHDSKSKGWQYVSYKKRYRKPITIVIADKFEKNS